MAEIKMDVSEYEAMKKVEKLLEDSLKREKTLNEKITTLNKEKIEALESSKMRVSKIIKTEHTTHIMSHKHPEEIIYELERIFSELRSPQGMRGYGHISRSANYGYIEHIIDRLFTKSTSISHPTEEIITEGLDEVKVELRKEIEDQISNDIKSKLKQADESIEGFNIITKENKELLKSINNIESYNKELEASIDAANILSEKLTTDNKELLESLNKFIKISGLINGDKKSNWRLAREIKTILKD